jgi:hypothetical protein
MNRGITAMLNWLQQLLKRKPETGDSPEETSDYSEYERSPVRKQIYDLTENDLQRFPFWEFALDEEGVEAQDEATVRPVLCDGAIDPAGVVLIVRARFTLADGTQFLGHMTVDAGDAIDLSIAQPSICLASGQVGFWFGITAPERQEIDTAYKLLDKTADQVFPLAFESDVAMTIPIIRGSIPGFLYLLRKKVQSIH